MKVEILILVITVLSLAVLALITLNLLQLQANRRKLNHIQKLLAGDTRTREALRARLNAMSEITHGFLTANDEGKIIELVLTHAMQATGALGASFVPLDERGQPTGVIRQGDFPFPLPEAWLEYLASPTIRHQCNDCKNYGNMMKVCPLLKGPTSQASGMYCLPLRRGDQDLGVLNLYLPDNSDIESESRDFINSLVDQTALALESIRLRKHKLTAISELGAVRQRGNLSEILGDLLLSLKIILEADYIFLAIKSHRNNWSNKDFPRDQFLVVGEKFSKDQENLVAKIIQQVSTTGKEYISGMLPHVSGRGKFVDTLIVEPLQLDDQKTLGVIAAGKHEKQSFNDHQKLLFRAISGQIALFIENAQGAKDVQYKAMIEERGRLAREIHDGLAQTLSFLKMQTAQMQSSLEKRDLERLSYFLKVSYSALAEAYQDTREAIDGLRLIGIRTDDEVPLQLDEAIQRVVQEYRENNMLSSVEVTLQCRDEIVELAPEVTAQLMRIVQEALSNVRKHSAATQVLIKARADTNDLILEVKDNGKGFAAEEIPEVSRHGLIGMRERAELIGADFQVISRPGEGTVVRVRLPLLERRKMEA